jgi:hypothetical protein
MHANGISRSDAAAVLAHRYFFQGHNRLRQAWIGSGVSSEEEERSQLCVCLMNIPIIRL